MRDADSLRQRDEPLILEARINEWALRGDNPHVPWSPEEIAADAEACWEAGASIVHFHVRNPDGSASHDLDLYAETIRLIRSRCDILIHPTLAGVITPDAQARLAPLRMLVNDSATRPDFVPMDMGSTNLDMYDPVARRFTTDAKVYVNTIGTLERIDDYVREAGLRELLCVWTVPCLRTIEAFLHAGRLSRPSFICLVLTEGGIVGGHPGTERGLQSLLDFMPAGQDIEWSVCCRHGSLIDLAPMILQKGGHISIGLGDHHYREIGAPSNSDLVRRIVAMAERHHRRPATVSETRDLLHMRSPQGETI
jgi:uncharacterized protein (DUF849 family)